MNLIASSIKGGTIWIRSGWIGGSKSSEKSSRSHLSSLCSFIALTGVE